MLFWFNAKLKYYRNPANCDSIQNISSGFYLQGYDALQLLGRYLVSSTCFFHHLGCNWYFQEKCRHCFGKKKLPANYKLCLSLLQRERNLQLKDTSFFLNLLRRIPRKYNVHI